MNCQDWEGRILLSLEGADDADVAGHLRECPACASFAAALAADARMLRLEPPEAAAVDYAAMRAAARRESVRRSWRPRVLAGLAAAATILLASRLAVHRDLPQTAHVAPNPPAVQVTHVDPPLAPRPPVRHTRPRRPLAYARGSDRSRDRQGALVRPVDDLDRQFADYLRSVEESPQPETATVTRIATGNPNVMIWLQEPKGNDHE